MFRSGFVNIIGQPNAGKSTLMNALVGERLAAVTSKVQTTRRRLLGIVNTENYQVIYSDNPGIIADPKYALQTWMNKQTDSALKDADVLLYLATPEEDPNAEHFTVQGKLKRPKVPLLLVVNKMDTVDADSLKTRIKQWQSLLPHAQVLAVSALRNINIASLQELITGLLPEHPPYFDAHTLTDQPERFFVAEIIREKILLFYRQEIPYSVEVAIESFTEAADLVKISAIIYTARESHKMILLGKGGSAIKKTGTEARKDIEAFLGKKVYLGLLVKVKENWKDDPFWLKQFGYH